MRLSHLTAVATLVALLGAMFVALPSAGAQSMMYYCTSVGPEGSTSLRVTNEAGTKGYVLTGDSPLSETNPAEHTLDLTQSVENTSADPCEDVDSDVNVADDNDEDAVDGDVLMIGVDDKGDADASNDTREWVRDYKEALGEAKSGKPNELLTDNPANPTSGVKDNPDTDADESGPKRPQSWTIPFEDTTFTEAVGNEQDKIERTDDTSPIVELAAVSAGSGGWTVKAKKAGTVTITVTDKRAGVPAIITTYTFEVQDKAKVDADAAAAEAAKSPALKIAFPLDSDGVVGDGTDVKVMISQADGAMLSSVTVSGGLDLYTNADMDTEDDVSDDEPGMQIGSRAGSAHLDEDGDNTLWVVIPKGQAAGEYTVAANGTESATSDKKISASKMITVGDSGTNVTTASLTLSPLDADGMPTTVAKAQSTQRSSAAAGGDAKTGTVYLSLAVLNSLDKASNPPFTVTISAAGANIDVMKVEKDDVEVQAAKSSQTGSLTFDAMAANLTLKITKATPGAVSVSAIVVDKAGGGYDGSDLIDLTFTGVSSEISLGDASGTLLMKSATSLDDDGKDTDKRDVISFSLGAVDKSGNATSIPDVSFQVTDLDGVNVPESKIAVSQGPSTAGLPNAKITLETKAGAATPLDNGEYTIKVSQSATITDMATFTVVGVGTSVEVEASNMAPDSVGDTVEVTATVADADGNPVADGTKVMFTSSDQTADSDQVLAHVGDRGAQSTKGGMAKATFVAVGDGTSVITAIADGTTGVVVVDSTAGAVEPEAMPEEEASVSCLSNLSGFSTWSCDVESSASEIFGLVSGRRVSAIHLHNGTAWVRYSVVDGNAIPGSSDFMVTKSDILYISN